MFTLHHLPKADLWHVCLPLMLYIIYKAEIPEWWWCRGSLRALHNRALHGHYQLINWRGICWLSAHWSHPTTEFLVWKTEVLKMDNLLNIPHSSLLVVDKHAPSPKQLWVYYTEPARTFAGPCLGIPVSLLPTCTYRELKASHSLFSALTFHHVLSPVAFPNWCVGGSIL